MPQKALMGIALAASIMAAGCGAAENADAEATEVSASQTGAADLSAAINGAHRSATEKARDPWRNPAETLKFFEFSSDMTVVEVWPGAGWYTNILAPALTTGGGKLYAAGPDPSQSSYALDAIDAFASRFHDNPDLYGEPTLTVLNGISPIAPEGSADLVLTFRNVHNWLAGDAADAIFASFFAALKPGGVLGVVEHRAADTAEDGVSVGGYVTENTVIALAERAGFVLEARSEVNANPADTKDYPYGVWTLPPVRRSGPAPGRTEDDFPRADYDKIGESDRMTLRFRKPASVDG